ncbi:MAG: hypothetical protein ACRDWA_05105 [Acidimicrobiia bacterium]
MVQPRQRDKEPSEPQVTIEELARRQAIEPLASIDQLYPPEPLFDDDEHAAFLEWLRELRKADIA